jgi:hypothetical protein
MMRTVILLACAVAVARAQAMSPLVKCDSTVGGKRKKAGETVIRQLVQRHRHVFQVVLAFCGQERLLNSALKSTKMLKPPSNLQYSNLNP